LADKLNASLDKLKQFYVKVDFKTQRLEQIHVARLNCRQGCSNCCVDEITVWNVEAENIRQAHAALLTDENANTNPGCAFLDQNGACRIYDSRPYVCRTQGLPLRWLDEIENEIYEFRDICPLNDTGEAVEKLSNDECWTIGDSEAALASLQSEFDNGEMRRVALRELFTENKESTV
jgi:Fe-S-cluster containining protein